MRPICTNCHRIVHGVPTLNPAPELRNTLFCGETCLMEYANQIAYKRAQYGLRTCKRCHASIEHKRADAIYCSQSCRTAASVGNQNYKPRSASCHMCGRDITMRNRGAKYCSPTCQSKWWRTQRKSQHQRAEEIPFDPTPTKSSDDTILDIIQGLTPKKSSETSKIPSKPFGFALPDDEES